MSKIPEAPRCQHLHDTGYRCGSPALRGQSFCYNHYRHYQPRFFAGQKGYRIPVLEECSSVELAVREILQGVNDDHLDLAKARVMLYGIQLVAPYSTRRFYFGPKDVEIELPVAMQSPTGASSPAPAPPAPSPNPPLALAAPPDPPPPVATPLDPVVPTPAPQDPVPDPASAATAPSGNSVTAAAIEASNSDVTDDAEIRDSIFHPDPAAVRAYWTQHLPADVANLRTTLGDLVYEPPEWLPLTEPQLAYLRNHLPPDNGPGTPEQQENLQRINLHLTHIMIKPPQPEAIREAWTEACESHQQAEQIFQDIRKSPEAVADILRSVARDLA